MSERIFALLGVFLTGVMAIALVLVIGNFYSGCNESYAKGVRECFARCPTGAITRAGANNQSWVVSECYCVSSPESK